MIVFVRFSANIYRNDMVKEKELKTLIKPKYIQCPKIDLALVISNGIRALCSGCTVITVQRASWYFSDIPNKKR